MFAEDFLPTLQNCPECNKILTDGGLCINCKMKMGPARRIKK